MSKGQGSRILAAGLALLFASTSARAGDCDGTPGYVLDVQPGVVLLGDPFEIDMTAPPGDLLFLMVSTGSGPVDTPAGQLCLSLPPLMSLTLAVPASGSIHLPSYMHCEPGFDGTTFNLQFIAFGAGRWAQAGISNRAQVTGTDDGRGCNYCTGGGTKPRLLRMRYTGKDCAASSHSQDPSKVTCTGDPAFASPIRIVAQDKPELGHHKAHVWFDGVVAVNQLFDVDARSGGQSRLRGETYIMAVDAQGQVIHRVGFHTSCSQPLHGNDQFGAFELEAFVAE